jgi:ABC-type sugar transport system permease subunit
VTTTTPADQATGARRKPGPGARFRLRDASEARLAFWLLIPTFVLLLLVVGFPILRAIYLSLFSDERFGTPEFIGLGNYTRALFGTGSAEFWAAFGVTTLITAISVGLELIIGLGMALIMHRAFKGRGLVRASVLVPWAIPTAVTALLWKWMYQPADIGGIVNAVLGVDILWLGRMWPSRFAIILADTWKTAPFIGLLLLAGLQIIPDELYEAAKVDGATAWQRFRRITLPLLKGSILVAVLFRLLDVLRIFDLPKILTNGANGTETMSMVAYEQAIERVRSHYGSALSVLTFAYIMLVAFLFVRLLGASVVQTQAREVR